MGMAHTGNERDDFHPCRTCAVDGNGNISSFDHDRWKGCKAEYRELGEEPNLGKGDET